MPLGRPRRYHPAALLCWLSLLVAPSAGAAPIDALQDRSEDPVVVSAAIVPELAGLPVEQIFVFRYAAETDGFVPIPFQVDERVDHLFDPFSVPNVYERIYDVFREDDGRLDANDEIAFLFADAGDAASPSAEWPARVDPDRFEIRIVDPRPGGTHPDRFAYVFTGTGLPRSSTSYVSWNGLPSSIASSDKFDVGFIDRWLVTGYRVYPPCGTGDNLFDRVKGRAGISLQQAESEDTWNANSLYLGGIVGPVRAIRYVQGAASGVDTVHHDIVYRGLWERVINLRVHPINGVWFYFDLLPRTGTTFFTSTVRAGVSVDGVNDSVGATLPAWTLIKGPSAGLATIWNVPPSPFYLSASLYYRDDASYDDAPTLEPGYGDRDNSAFGNHGVYLDALTGDANDTIPASFRLYPLCFNEGDPSLGDALRQLFDYPLQMSVVRQTKVASAVRSLSVARSGLDVLSAWQPVSGATSYRVYAATAPDLPRGSWTLLGESASTAFLDAGALGDAVARYYSVTAVTAAGEGPW